jgi:hypothetical protein
MSAKLWNSRGSELPQKGIFNNFSYKPPPIFCNFAIQEKSPGGRFLKTLAYHSPDFD